MKDAVFVVGLGLFTSIGRSADETWQAMLAGRSGVRPIRRFDTTGLPTRFAAMVDDDPLLTCGQRCVEMGRSAIGEAVRHAGVAMEPLKDAGFFLAAPTPDNDWSQMLGTRNSTASDPRRVFFSDEYVAGFGDSLVEPYGPRTSPILVNTACASGATALEMALETLRDGDQELAVVAGSDSMVYDESIAKFCLLSALSTANEAPAQACRPFSSDRDGFVMGEGAAALVLATGAAAERLGLRRLARVTGAGNATDGFHRTRSSPDGSSIIASMQRALANGGLAPEQIGHINAHGTGTPENDKMESVGIRAVFGDHASRIPLTANKSMVGHTLTAAGAIEAVVSVMTLQSGIIPPTLNYERPDPELGVAVVGNAPRRVPVEHVLSNSFGFGGQNVSLILSRAEAA